MKQSTRTFFRHVHNPDTHKESGSLTFLISVDFENLQFSFAFSRCSKRDEFNKKVGRATVTGRMGGGSVIRGPWNPGLSTLENVKVALKNTAVNSYTHATVAEELRNIISVLTEHEEDYILRKWS